MKLEFDDELHEYKIDGTIVPSATQVINDIMPGYDAGDYYKARGKAMHVACELYDQGRLDWDTVHPEIIGKVRAWAKFRTEWNRPILASETAMGHPAYMVAGRIDRVFQGEKLYHVLCDLKSALTPQVRIQLGFYSLLWKRTNMDSKTRRLPETRGVAVELRNNGSYSCLWMKADEIRRHEQDALNCLGVYNFRKLYKLKGKAA